MLSPDSTFFTLNVWVHVVATISSSAQSLYGNGQLVSTRVNSPSFLPNMVARSQQYIGKSNWGADGFFAGTIAYVRIWNGYALSATEVLTLYNNLGQQVGPGAASCLSCSAGYYSTSSASACTSCPVGQYQGSTGATSCLSCSAGYYSTSSASACTSCPAGQYQGSTSSANACTSCPGGQYQGGMGATSCLSCSAGYYSALPVTAPSYEWDFRGCTTGSPVRDTYTGTLVATPANSPVCSSSGASMDGLSSQSYTITSWSWGGATSLEAYAMYSSYNQNARIFDFGSGMYADNLLVCISSSSGQAVFEG